MLTGYVALRAFCAPRAPCVLQDADVVIVEYSLNDEIYESSKLFDNTVRRPFERLLRRLQRYPKRPAVVLLNAWVGGGLGAGGV